MALMAVTEMLLLFLTQRTLQLSNGRVFSVKMKVRLPDGKELSGTEASISKHM